VSSTTRIFCAIYFFGSLDQALHGVDELLEVDRLADEGVEAGGGDLAAIGRRYRRRERDDRDARGFRIAANLLEGLDAVDARQLDVHQHQVGHVLLGELDAFLAGDGFQGLVALVLQHVARELHVLVVVFDDQGLCSWRLYCRMGRVTVNVEPWPGWLASVISPPCSSTKRLVERKAKAGALGLARVVAPDLLELLEHRGMVLGRDADAGVLDRDGHAGGVELRADVDAPAVRGELHRVRQQVEQDLLELALVGVKLAEPLIDVERKPDAVALRPLANQRHRVGDRGGQMERGNLQVHAPGLDLERSRMSLMSESRCRPDSWMSFR